MWRVCKLGERTFVVSPAVVRQFSSPYICILYYIYVDINFHSRVQLEDFRQKPLCIEESKRKNKSSTADRGRTMSEQLGLFCINILPLLRGPKPLGTHPPKPSPIVILIKKIQPRKRKALRVRSLRVWGNQMSASEACTLFYANLKGFSRVS